MFVFYVLVVTVDTSVQCDREIIPRQVNRFPDRRRTVVLLCCRLSCLACEGACSSEKAASQYPAVYSPQYQRLSRSHTGAAVLTGGECSV